jgi:hypothetical protein
MGNRIKAVIFLLVWVVILCGGSRPALPPFQWSSVILLDVFREPVSLVCGAAR